MKLVRVSHQGEKFYAILENTSICRIEGDYFTDLQPCGKTYALEDVCLLAPILPSKIVCVGKNYLAHAEEFDGIAPDEPLLFLKPSTSVIAHEDKIVHPPDCSRLDYEAELAVVIGRRCKDVPLGASEDVILGYTCLNDVTARDLQASDGQWTRSKSYDTFCPIGPWIETELDVKDIRISARLNGKLCQDARTSALIHDVDKLIYYISRVMTLLPGDIIATGTPAGVGAMRQGDVIEVELEGIGVLRNTVG